MINENNISRILRNNSINHIGISIDGDEKIHNIMRGSNNSFSKAVAGLKLIRNRIPASIVCVITEENFDSIYYA